jgi:hypothetical protein
LPRDRDNALVRGKWDRLSPGFAGRLIKFDNCVSEYKGAKSCQASFVTAGGRNKNHGREPIIMFSLDVNIECRTRNIEPQKPSKFAIPYAIFDIFLTAMSGFANKASGSAGGTGLSLIRFWHYCQLCAAEEWMGDPETAIILTSIQSHYKS